MAKRKTEKVKARPKASSSVKRTRTARSTSPAIFWPNIPINSRRSLDIELTASENAKLRPLKCANWSVVLNPDFGYLTVVPKPGTAITAQKWKDCFSSLGHDYDFVARISKTMSVLVSRPVCTDHSPKRLVFCFLIPPKPVAPIE
jgi:hypothetical protein